MRAAERIVCEAMKAASPIQTVARVGGEFKCTRPTQRSEPIQIPQVAKPQSRPPITTPFAGNASPLKSWQMSTGVMIPAHASRTAMSVVSPAMTFAGFKAVSAVRPAAMMVPTAAPNLNTWVKAEAEVVA